MPLCCFLAGLSIAFTSRHQNLRGESKVFWRNPYCLGLMMFVGFVLLPLGSTLFIFHPAWSFLYWIGQDDSSFFHLLLLWVLSLGGALSAFLLGEMLCRQGLMRLLEVALGSGLALLLLFFLLYGDRFGRLSDDGQWESAPLLLGTNVGTIFAFAIPVVFGGWIYLLVLFELEGRKFQRAVGDADRFAQGAPAVGANWMATPSEAQAFEAQAPEVEPPAVPADEAPPPAPPKQVDASESLTEPKEEG